jgi:hypothetical protein
VFDCGHGFAQRNERFVEETGRSGERGVEFLQLARNGQCTAYGVLRIRAFGFAQQRHDLARARCKSAALREALAFGRQLFDLVGFQRQSVELVQVIFEELQARFAVQRCCGYAFAFFAQRAQLFEGASSLGEELFVLAVPIEQGALRGTADQGLILHLTVHFDEQLAELTQRLYWHRLAVDVSPRTAVRADDATQLAFALVLDRLICEPGKRGIVTGKRECRRHLSAFAAVPYNFRACASAGRKQQGIDQNGFARTGFAGEHGQTGIELELDGIDNGEIANLNVREHSSPSGELVRRLDPIASSPTQLGTQDSVVIVVRRMEQSHVRRRTGNHQPVARQKCP